MQFLNEASHFQKYQTQQTLTYVQSAMNVAH